MACSLHFPAIQKIPDLKLVALCDIDPERLKTAAVQFGIANTFTDIEEMLDNCDLDAVSIIGQPSLHVLGAQKCLKRQIPFMTEKPLAIKVDEAGELTGLADKYGDCGQVGYTNRYSPAQRLAWQVSHSDEFGKISYVSTTHYTMSNIGNHGHIWGIKDRVETLIQLHGVHAIDLWRFFGGDPYEVSASVAEVSASVAGEKQDENSVFASVLAYVRTINGPHGVIHIKTQASHNGDINTDIMGNYSRIRVENDKDVIYERSGANGNDWVRRAMADDVLRDTFLADQPVGQFIGNGMISHSYWGDFFHFEWMAFADSLLSGKSLSPSIKDAYRTVCLT
ncbi:MAG: Gfo/Idh/MocA family oxidoreductase, partial [Clostridiales bacterium]|nr:Gfo/Idh/MocA family oxidoreductase [Clostridiales bacterium]